MHGGETFRSDSAARATGFPAPHRFLLHAGCLRRLALADGQEAGRRAAAAPQPGHRHSAASYFAMIVFSLARIFCCQAIYKNCLVYILDIKQIYGTQ